MAKPLGSILALWVCYGRLWLCQIPPSANMCWCWCLDRPWSGSPLHRSTTWRNLTRNSALHWDQGFSWKSNIDIHLILNQNNNILHIYIKGIVVNMVSTRPPNEQEVSNLAALYKIRCWNLSIRLHARVGVNLSRVKPKIGHDGPLPKLVKKGHCSKRTNFSCSSYTFSPRKCMTQCKLYQSYRIIPSS